MQADTDMRFYFSDERVASTKWLLKAAALGRRDAMALLSQHYGSGIGKLQPAVAAHLCSSRLVRENPS